MAIPFTLPPKGRVALVYCDVRYGAALYERIPDTMAHAMALYEALLRKRLAEHGGHEVKSEGYAFLTVWKSVAVAVRWALEVQEELLEQHWPLRLLEQPEAAVVRSERDEVLQRGLRVRMGVHVGEPEARLDERTRQMKYYGPPVSHAARLAGAALGGQVLLSSEAYAEVAGHLDKGVGVSELGSFRLRGRRGAVDLVQLLPASLGARSFAPLRTVDTRRSNLMPDWEIFLGRRGDMNALDELLAMGVRLVSVCGPAGIGKTRVLERFCIEALESWREDGGVWYCDLSEATTLDGLLREVGRALDVPLTAGRTADDSIAQLGHAIAGRGPMLLALDAFDGVSSWAERTLQRWLRSAPKTRFLVGTRLPLGLRGEVGYALGAMSLPEEGDAESVRLFEHTARSANSGFRLEGTAVPQVFELVRAVAGAPLGIRLVAAHAGRLPASEILRGVAERTLRYEPGHASRPEDGLVAATDWAWDQLSFWERDAVAQCAVFRGGFDIEAAEAVLDLSEHLSAPWIGDVLHSLTEKHLVRRIEAPEAPGVPRYQIHRRIAEHASRRLPDAQRAAAQQRHAAHYLGLATRWSKVAYMRGGGEAMARLALEMHNLLAVHDRALSSIPLGTDGLNRALQVAVALDPLFSSWGPIDTHLALLDSSLDACRAATVEVDERLRVQALRSRSEVKRFRGRTQEALADLEKGRVLAKSIGDRTGQAACLSTLGTLLRHEGQTAEAVPYLELAVEICREEGDRRQEALALGSLAVCLMTTGQIDSARKLFVEAIGRLRLVGDVRHEAVLIGNLGVLYRQQGDLPRAAELYADALAGHRQTGNRRLEGVMLGNLGALQYHRGRLDAAEDLYRRSRTLAREVGYLRSQATALANLGVVALERQDYAASRASFEEAVALHASAADRVGGAVATGYLGLLHHHQGAADEAREHYLAAIAVLSESGDRRFEGLFLAWMALLEIENKSDAAATELLGKARVALEASGEPGLLLLLGLIEAAADKDQLDERLGALGDQLTGDVRLAALRLGWSAPA